MQLLISQRAGIAWFAFPDNCRFVSPCCRKMFVDAVVRHIRFTAHEPLCVGCVPFQDRVVRLEPVQFVFGEFVPKPDGIGLGFLVQSLVWIHRANRRLVCELLRRRKESLFSHDGIDLAAAAVGHVVNSL